MPGRDVYEEERCADSDQSFITSFPESLSYLHYVSRTGEHGARGQIALDGELLQQRRLGGTVDETVLAAGANRVAECGVVAARHGAAEHVAIVAEHRHEGDVTLTVHGVAVVEAVLAVVDLGTDDRVVTRGAVGVLGLDVDQVRRDGHGRQRADKVRVDDDSADLHDVPASLGRQAREGAGRQVAGKGAAGGSRHDDLH